MAVPQLADVKEEHNRMEKSDVTFVLERRTELLNDYEITWEYLFIG